MWKSKSQKNCDARCKIKRKEMLQEIYANLTNSLVENKFIFWINTNLKAFYMRVQGGRSNKMEQSYYWEP